jgi:hypothetical protein
MTEDSVEVRLGPLHAAMPALQVLGSLLSDRRRAALSPEAVTLLGYVGWHREATRRHLEELRGEDCAPASRGISSRLATSKASRARAVSRYRLGRRPSLSRTAVRRPASARRPRRDTPFLGGKAGSDGAVTVDGEGVSPAGESAGGTPLVGTEVSASSTAPASLR